MSRHPHPSKRRRLSDNSDLASDTVAPSNENISHVNGRAQSALVSKSQTRLPHYDSPDESDSSQDGSPEVERAVEDRGPKAAPLKHRRSRNAGVPQHATPNEAQMNGPNAMRLQLEELLENSRFRSGKLKSNADQALRKLRTIIDGMPAAEPLPIHEAERAFFKKNRIAVPFPTPRPAKDSNYKLEFRKPTHINVVGSYSLMLIGRPKPALVIDMLVIMPSDLFQEKDYLDHRYFYRRAYYVAHIAAAIRRDESGFKLSYGYLNGNYLQPVVRVHVDPEATPTSKKTIIQIVPGVSGGVFSVHRTLPSTNSVRNGAVTECGSTTASPTATPFYNGSIRADALYLSYLKLFSDTSKSCEAFADACTLGRIWLSKRGFTSSVHAGGFGNFEWACTIAALLEANRSGKGILSPGYNSYQMFKAVLQFLATHDLVQAGYSTSSSAVSLPLPGSQPCFHDAVRGHNVLFKMTEWSSRSLRQAAQNTVALLANSVFDKFGPSFIEEATDPNLRQDATIRMPLKSFHSQLASPDKFAMTLRQLYEILQKALTDRVRLIGITMPDLPSWSLDSAPSSLPPSRDLTVALIVDPAQVARAMDRGPSVDHTKDVKAYLSFWGQEKAVRMKFGSESPIETVKWETTGAGPSVIQQIIEHVFHRHFPGPLAEATHISADEFVTQALRSSRPLGQGIQPGSTLSQAFVTFERDLRAIQGLPLQIRHVLPAGAALRDPSLKLDAGGQPHKPIDVVVRFELSNRWPEDLAAIQRTKIVFLLKLRELYAAGSDALSSTVGLENEQDAILNQGFLDVIYIASKVTFRVRIDHEFESVLLSNAIKDPLAPEGQRKRAARAFAEYKRAFLARPAHTQAIQSLCRRFPSLPVAIRLTKAWFATHLLLGEPHIWEELVELMVARAFTQPWPWETPGSPTTAFLRTLHWLAAWDWKTEPLIVDLSTGVAAASDLEPVTISQTLRAKDIEAIQTRFEAHRHLDPALNHLVIFAASSADREGNTWSDNNHPSKVVAARMTRLTQAASLLLRNAEQSVAPRSLFAVDQSHFDFVLSLDDRAVSAERQKGRTALYKNLESLSSFADREKAKKLNVVQAYIEELRAIYGDAVVLFHDPRDGRWIAGLWNPSMDQYRWKVKLPVSASPALTNDHAVDTAQQIGDDVSDAAAARRQNVKANRAAILDEMRRLGGDMIKRVDVH